MKQFLIILIVLFFSCNPSGNQEKNYSMGSRSEVKIKNNIRSLIVDKCALKFSNFHIIDVTISKLYQNSILYMQPVVYNEFLEYKSIPSLFFEHKDVLYLIYNGLDNILYEDEEYSDYLQNKFDSTCKVNNIKSLSSTFSIEPLIFKIHNDSLIEYSSEKYIDFFYGLKLDTSKYIPPNLE